MNALISIGNRVMENDTAVETHCTSCHTPYKVPEHVIGKQITCKKCGHLFELARGNGGSTVIGKLALKYKFIDKDQYTEALSAQRTDPENGCRVAFEDILVEKGLITPKQLRQLSKTRDFLEIRKKDKRRGAIMVEKGYCTQEEIDNALVDQSERFKNTLAILRIDDILIDSGILSTPQSQPVSRAGMESGFDGKDYQALFSITLSDDKTRAFLSLKTETTNGATVSGTKSYLKSEGIIHGIVNDDSLSAFLGQPNDFGRPIKVAEGKAPTPGIDAVVQYYFDMDRLKSETIQGRSTRESLSADEIPLVKEGQVIAEKIPVVLATPGIDVFGRKIPVIEANDHELHCGEGALLSENGINVTAAVSGQPDVAPNGEIRVLSALKIPGDVDSHSRPIYFSGEIHVAGSIKPGATVKGGSLAANEIAGAEIDVTGSVTVAGGIVDARIQARGDVVAKYIKGANIFASGNVSAQKEIMNSEISTSSQCRIPNGKILSSVISAGNGILAGKIGSEMANPSTLRPGVDIYAEKEMAAIDTDMEEKNKELARLKAANIELDKANTNLHQQIANLAQTEDRALLEHRCLLEKIEGFRNNDQTDGLAEAEMQLQKLDDQAKQAGDSLSNLFDKQDAISEKAEAVSGQINGIQKEVEKLRSAADAVIKRSEGKKRRATVTVNHVVYEGTIVSGIRAKKVLPGTYKNVLITEVKKSGSGPEGKWEFQVFPQNKEDSGSHISEFHGT